MKVKRFCLANALFGSVRLEKNSLLLLLFLFNVLISAELAAQPTEFTYQGSLQDNGAPADASYDFQFALFDQLAAGTQVGTTLTRGNVPVAGGIFTVELDFGNQFPGAERFLEIRVRPAGGGAYTTLAPRQQIASVPYAISATSLGGVAANQYVLTSDPRLSDPRSPLPSSPHYIQNSTNPQAASNFNISGTGKANFLDAADSFRIAGQRILHSPNTSLYAGRFAGAAATSGNFNSFFGQSAGQNTTTGGENSFFGIAAGYENTTGVWNSFFGSFAGSSNTSANSNSYFGQGAGASNQTGSENSVFGARAGSENTAGGNSYFGYSAGELNVSGTANSVFGRAAFRNAVTGSGNAIFGAGAGNNSSGMEHNSFFGARAGLASTSGSSNAFFGYDTGATNRTGGNNTLLGAAADVGASDLNFATAIGAGSVVSASDSIVIGRLGGFDTLYIPGSVFGNGYLSGDIVNALRAYNIDGQRVLTATTLGTTITGIGAGLANPVLPLEPQGLEANGGGNPPEKIASRDAPSGDIEPGSVNSFFGSEAGFANALGSENTFLGSKAGKTNVEGRGNTYTGSWSGFSSMGSWNSLFGRQSGLNITTGSDNTFLGSDTGGTNTTGNGNTLVGSLANVGSSALINATAIGHRAYVTQSNSLVLGSISGINESSANTNVGIGTSAPNHPLHIATNNSHIIAGAVGCGSGFVGISFGSPNGSCFRYSILGNGADTMLNAPPDGSILFRIGNITRATLHASGVLALPVLGSAGATALCRNASNQVSTCSSSSRYKSDIASFAPGLDLITRLRPVSFTWREGGSPDFGLIAEEVADAEPLLTTLNSDGETEGVKYDRLGVVLVNAVKEQQQQIEAKQRENQRQNELIRRQQAEIDHLKARQIALEAKVMALVCLSQSDAKECVEAGKPGVAP